MNLERNDIWVIGLGASAGGLEALGQFMKELPEDLPASIIIAQHLAPHSKSMMVELLSRKSNLKVTQAENGLSLSPNTVIIIPPNFDLTLHEGKVRLIQASEETRPKPSINTFFASLGREFGPKAVGIVLSGTGSDGSEGIIKIKEVGGITFAQDTSSAKYDGMPKSAAQTGVVDFIGPPSEIAQKVADLILNDQTYIKSSENISTDDFEEILQFLKTNRNMDFTLYKPNTLKRRLDKRMRQIGIFDMKNYLQKIKKNNEEADSLVQEMLISVTSFFRDKEAFDHLEEVLEKMILKKKNGDDFRVWVAGCATGEEPYGLGMMILDLMNKHNCQLNLKIFASDLDHEAIQVARNGIYRRSDVEASVSPERREEYFIFRDQSVEVKKSLRERIVFARQDMIHHPPFVKIDLVSCRNVLIYFKPELQHKIFDIFHYALNDSGYLFLGKSETLPNGNNFFKVVDKSSKIYQKSISEKTYPFHIPSRTQTPIPVKVLKKEAPPIESTVLKDILSSYDLSAVLIDSEGVILHIFGDVSEYLSLTAGVADFKLTNLLSRTIGSEVHLLLRKVTKEGLPVKGRPHLIDLKVGRRFLSVKIKPFDSDIIKNHFLVSFELSMVKEAEPIEIAHNYENQSDLTIRLMELEQEVMAGKESLQAVVEELSVSNEELQSVNEELSSTNEEMQASNEELETTNEELQSTNEELTTLNEELNVKTQELKLSNASLENIQSSIGSPLVVIDSNLKVVRFNQLANKIFTINSTHIGKAIVKVSCNAEIPDFEEHLRHTIETGESGQLVIQVNRSFYQFQIHPCLDELNKIIGAILIFFDNTDIVAAEARLKLGQSRTRSIIDGSPALIALKDSYGKYLSVNSAFLKYFNLKEEEVLGKNDRELFTDSLATQFRDHDLEVLLKKTPTEVQEKIVFEDKESVFLASRFPLFDMDNGKNPYALGIVLFDITKQYKAQEALESSELRYRALIEDQAVFVTRFKSNGEITYVNNPFMTFFGGSLESEIGKTFFQYVDSDKKEQVKKELLSITPSQPVITIEHTFKNLNRPVKWVRWIVRGLFNQENHLQEIQAVGFDVTELKVRSDELKEKEKIYGSILSFSSDFLFVYSVIDKDTFELESFNRSAESTYINTNNAYIGRNLHDFVDPDKYPKVLGCYQKCLETKKPLVFEETIELPAGAKSFQTTLVPILSAEGGVEKIAAVSRDISKFKQVESALREEKILADSASQSKSDFLASMSHELRTPLNVILGMTDLLMTTKLDHDQSRYSDSIKKSGKMLLSLIEDVLDLSKIESGKISFERKPFLLSQLCQEISTAFEIQAQKKGLEFSISCMTENTHRLLGDETRIRQILVNLISNAIKFTAKGSVRVNVYEDDSKPLISKLRFEVLDTGVGIPEESFGRLFTRFSQADRGHTRKFGGTGLGLAISKQLVDLMQGDIGFNSEEGIGSTFWFELQLTRSQSSSKVDSPPKKELSQKSSEQINLKILVVDDYKDSHHLMKAFMNRLGHETTMLTSGKEALEHLKQGGDYDIIFMDVQMPEMDGMETTRKIRLDSKIKQSPIIALTANVMKGMREEALDSGMDDFLTKPVSLVSLKEKIEQWKNHY